MRSIILMIAFTLFTGSAQAQNMDVSGFVITPQADDGKMISERSFGYGLSATYAFDTDTVAQPIGVLQYHNHDPSVNADIGLSVGVRATALQCLYLQGTAGMLEKRNPGNYDQERKPGFSIGAGFVPGALGVQASYFISDFGNHYGAGLVFRF